MAENTFTLLELSERRKRESECVDCKTTIKRGKERCDSCCEKYGAKNWKDLRECIQESKRKFALSGHDKEYNEYRRLCEQKGYKFNKDGTLK